MSPDLTIFLSDPNRLAALRSLDLLDSPQEEAFDRLVRLTARTLHAPVALITLLDADRQFIKSYYGPHEPWASQQNFPIENAICRNMLVLGAPLTIANIRYCPHTAFIAASATFEYTAYAGAPLIIDAQYVVGSLCVLDTIAREWTEDDIINLTDLAASVMSEINRRAEGAERKRAEEALNIRARQQAAIAELGQHALVRTDLTALFNDAVALVAETLNVEFCEALEMMPNGRALRLRAGAGWREGMVGRAIVGVGKETLAGYTLFSNQPVIVDDLRTETRFQGPDLLLDHGVINGMSVIIRGQEEPFGILGAHTAQQRMFTSDDVSFLQSVANVLGTAIGRKRADQAIAFQAHLLNIVEQAVIATNLQGTITYWNRFAERLYGWTQDEAIGQDMLALLADESALSETHQALANYRSERWTGELRMRRRDGTTFPAYLINSPIRDEQGAIAGSVGVSVDVTERKRIEEVQREARDQLEGQVALRTVELREVNQQLARWVKELEQRNAEVLLLSELSELLQTCLSINEAYVVLGQTLPRLFARETGALYIRAQRTERVAAVAEWGLVGPPTFANDDCWALRRGRPHMVDHSGGGPVCQHTATLPAADTICVPISVQNEMLGVLHVRLTHSDTTATPKEKNTLTESCWRLAITVAEHIALALSNLNLRETLRQQALRDPLTNLFNRRYMEESLEREVSRAMRRESNLGVVMLDIDHFKQVNDRYGHAAGDALLQSIGSILLSHTRGEDIACRYGGEEFTLIMPDSSLADTFRRAEQLRLAVKRLSDQISDKQFDTVTISAGVASFPQHGTTPDALLHAADQALYKAKTSGRDQVVRQGNEQ